LLLWSYDYMIMYSCTHRNNDFVEVSKISAKYRPENNFISLLKYIYNYQNYIKILEKF